ncbi:adenylate/guanylate cyclase domain-containing protein [Bacteroidota bacterium]
MAEDKFNILYVDDEEQNLISFKAALRRRYTIYTAHSAIEGMEVLRNYDIQLIITDQRMPEMTGVEFLEKILPEYPDTIRMVLTGYSDVEAIIKAINSGRVFRYITKPWDHNELTTAIENARQMSSLQQHNKTLFRDLHDKVQEQEQTLKMFIKYVPEPVVHRALESTEESIFEGEQRNIAVLFCDIRGFTPMSEYMKPREVVSFLNCYYSLMTGPIIKHNGSVSQYVGDEIFATFGAPIAYPDNELNAVFCALDMMGKLRELNDKYESKISEEVKMGIGINSGEVVAGNVGSEEKINYSVTGDTVNTGKRIEMITREHPNKVLISEKVFNATKDFVEVIPWGPVKMKGKKEKINIYEVLNRKT